MTSLQLVVVCGGGFVAALIATFACRSFALRLGIVNHPNPLVAQHVQPIAYLGGVGLAVGVACAMIAGLAVGDRPAISVAHWRWDVVAGGLMFLFIGLLDDVIALSPLRKLLLQSAASVAVVYVAALQAPLPISWLHASAYFACTIILVNAVNLVDVCDGLVAGLATVAGITFVAIRPQEAFLPMALVGASIGFLVWNKPKATIFLGDAGSHFIGFLLAALSSDELQRVQFIRGATTVSLANGVFLFELAFLVVVRHRKGIPWWRGSSDHFALRLQAAGFSCWRVDVVAWSIACLLGLCAALVARDANASILCGVAMVLAASWVWRFLLDIEVTQPEGVTSQK